MKIGEAVRAGCRARNKQTEKGNKIKSLVERIK
jgi:hypothetical protein